MTRKQRLDVTATFTPPASRTRYSISTLLSIVSTLYQYTSLLSIVSTLYQQTSLLLIDRGFTYLREFCCLHRLDDRTENCPDTQAGRETKDTRTDGRQSNLKHNLDLLTKCLLFKLTILHCKVILGRGQPALMRYCNESCAWCRI